MDEESEHESDTDRENDTEEHSELEDEEQSSERESIENKEIALRYDTTVEGGRLVAVMGDDTDSSMYYSLFLRLLLFILSFNYSVLVSERKRLWQLIEDQSFQDNTLLCKSLDINNTR